MKKLIAFLFALILMAPVYTEAKGNKNLEKALNKEYKTKLKEFKKGKWEAIGGRTLDVVVARHLDRLNELGEDAHEIEGTFSAKTKDAAVHAAAHNAMVAYAGECGSQLRGRALSDINVNGLDSDGDFNNFCSTYERLVEKEIKGDIEHSYSIQRKTADGRYEVRSFFIVNEKAAVKARRRALNAALENSELARKYANELSGFVEDGMNKK